jgi:hypothetical protein
MDDAKNGHQPPSGLVIPAVFAFSRQVSNPISDL